MEWIKIHKVYSTSTFSVKKKDTQMEKKKNANLIFRNICVQLQKKKIILLLLRLGFSTLKSYGQKRDASWDSTFSVKNFVLFFFLF